MCVYVGTYEHFCINGLTTASGNVKINLGYFSQEASTLCFEADSLFVSCLDDETSLPAQQCCRNPFVSAFHSLGL